MQKKHLKLLLSTLIIGFYVFYICPFKENLNQWLISLAAFLMYTFALYLILDTLDFIRVCNELPEKLLKKKQDEDHRTTL